MHRPSTKRFSRPDMHRDIRPPNGRKNTQSIGRRPIEGGIAVDGTNTKKIKSGMVGGEEDGESVLKGGRRVGLSTYF